MLHRQTPASPKAPIPVTPAKSALPTVTTSASNVPRQHLATSSSSLITRIPTMPAKDRLRIVPPTAPSGLKRKEYPESDNPRPSAIRKTKRVRLQAQPVMPTFREALMQRGRKVYIDPACTWWLRKLVVALDIPSTWQSCGAFYLVVPEHAGAEADGRRAALTALVAARGTGAVLESAWLAQCLEADQLVAPLNGAVRT